jgi:hypothetical protein
MQTSVYDFCGYKNESESVELSLYRQILTGNHIIIQLLLLLQSYYNIIFKQTFLQILIFLVAFVGSNPKQYFYLMYRTLNFEQIEVIFLSLFLKT